MVPCAAGILEMGEDIGKAGVSQRRRPAGPIKELGVDKAGNEAQGGPEQAGVQSGSVLVKLPALRQPLQHTECSFGKQ